MNCLLSGHFHLDFLLLNVLKSIDLIPLVHFSLPSGVLRGILQADCHIIDTCLNRLLFLIVQVLFSLQSRSIEFDVGLLLFKIRHGSSLINLAQLLGDRLLDLLFYFLCAFRRSRPTFCRQIKALLVARDVVAAYGFGSGLAPLLLVLFDISKTFLMGSCGKRARLNVSLDFHSRLNHLIQFWLRQIERLYFRSFEKLLFFDAVFCDFVLVCTVFDKLKKVRYSRQISLNTADNLFINVLVIIDLDPWLTQVLSKCLRIEGELEEDVHLFDFLAQYKLPVVTLRQFV